MRSKSFLTTGLLITAMLVSQSAEAVVFSRTAPSTTIESLSQWRSMVSRGMSAKSCARCSEIISGLSGERGAMREVLTRVNRAVNGARYRSDRSNWREADRWATPSELFERGGDCEDFAIAKMMMLRSLGVPSRDMRVLVFPASGSSPAHAVLAVNTGQGTMVLDNRRRDIYPISTRESSRYFYAFNDQRVWLAPR